MRPEFIPPEYVLKLHELHLEANGGLGGVRDLNLLESAVAQPEASFGGQFLHEDLFAMAAAYLFHIVKNHPFVDGNKRVGLATALIFLNMNEQTFDMPTNELENVTLSVAAGSLSKGELTDFFRRVAKPIGPTRLVEP